MKVNLSLNYIALRIFQVLPFVGHCVNHSLSSDTQVVTFFFGFIEMPLPNINVTNFRLLN